MAINSANILEIVGSGKANHEALEARMKNIFGYADKHGFFFSDTFSNYAPDGEFSSQQVRDLIDAGVTFYERTEADVAAFKENARRTISEQKARGSRMNVVDGDVDYMDVEHAAVEGEVVSKTVAAPKAPTKQAVKPAPAPVVEGAPEVEPAAYTAAVKAQSMYKPAPAPVVEPALVDTTGVAEPAAAKTEASVFIE